MKKIAVVLLLMLVGCSEKDPLSNCPDPGRFEYDASSGVCRNCNGAQGYNKLDIEQIKKTKNASCLYLMKLELMLLKNDSITFGYDTLSKYDFRGTVFDSCRIYFNHIMKADLRGADLTTLQYGYSLVAGRRDQFTKAPVLGTVVVEGDSIRCMD